MKRCILTNVNRRIAARNRHTNIPITRPILYNQSDARASRHQPACKSYLRISNNLQTRPFTTSPPKSQEAAKPPPLPLTGALVVSLEQAISAPLCTRHLADLGARVLKIERPGTGDFNRHHDRRVKDQCSHFVWTNRSKESVCLDLKDEKDLAALKELIKRADVFVQNLAPGAAQRLGLGWEVLREGNERLVVCDVSGYGGSGPYRDKKAYDLLIQGTSTSHSPPHPNIYTIQRNPASSPQPAPPATPPKQARP